MPYADRQQQLTYMRNYMKHKRMVDRLARLRQRKQDLLKDYDEGPFMQVFVARKEVGPYIDSEIARLEGLLKNRQNSAFSKRAG